MKLCALILAGLLAASLSHSLRGQESASVWDGIYAEDQAKRGDQDYRKECAKCHGAHGVQLGKMDFDEPQMRISE